MSSPRNGLGLEATNYGLGFGLGLVDDVASTSTVWPRGLIVLGKRLFYVRILACPLCTCELRSIQLRDLHLISQSGLMISGQIEGQRGLTTANDASKLFKNVVQIP